MLPHTKVKNVQLYGKCNTKLNIRAKSGGDRGNLKAMGQGICENQLGHAETKALPIQKVKNVHVYGNATLNLNPSTQACRNKSAFPYKSKLRSSLWECNTNLLKPKDNDGHEPINHRNMLDMPHKYAHNMHTIAL